MKALYAICVIGLAVRLSFAADFGVRSFDRNGVVTWSNALPAGVVTVETKGSLTGAWTAQAPNYFTSNAVGSGRISLSPTQTFVRLLSVDISTNTPNHYTNLLQSYGILETVAGRGRTSTDVSHWSNSFEGEWATNVDLSRPHISFGDAWGNVLIVDQRSSAVLRVTPQGRLYTYAGTHVAGDNGDTGWATNLNLNNPNGGWMRVDGTLYILDTDNAKVRRVDTNGWMTTLFTTPPLGDGRAFWINSNETVAYFGSGGTPTSGAATNLHRWTSTGGVTTARSDFLELGNIVGDERTGNVYVSDRLANRVYRMDTKDTNFTLTPIAGNGTQSGGGEGFPALQTGLILPRSVWFIPNGGFFIGEHDPGNRIWYVDPAGIIHRWMNGDGSDHKRVGDGQWFYANPSLAKVSRVRCVNTDPNGNIIITESNFGYVRRIRFERLTP